MPKQEIKKKYRMSEMMSDLPEKKAKKLRSDPLTCVGVGRSAFFRHLAIEQGSNESIPVDSMAGYAAYFECSIEDLIQKDSF